MNRLIIEILILTSSIVYIVDYSGVIIDISKLFHKITSKKNTPWTGQIIGKPFSCSECLTFWTAFGLSLYQFGIIESLGIASISAISSKLIKKITGLAINNINKIK